MSDKTTGMVALDIDRFDCPSGECPHAAYVTLGENDAANLIINERPTIWEDRPIESAIRELIGAEILAKPKDVGPPISIIALDRDGTHWLDRGSCAAR
jgi:hypothetical protein